MNFFRKKNHINATLSVDEVSGASLKLIKDLQGLLPIPPKTEVRISLSGASEISLPALAAIVSFSHQLAREQSTVSLQAGQDLLEKLNKYNFSPMFSELKPAEES